jgi:hypothetical protein
MAIRSIISCSLVLVIMAMCGSGCVSSGAQVTDQQVASIKTGQTTEADLINMWGQPRSSQMTMNGNKQLAWVHVEMTNFMDPFGPHHNSEKGIIVTVDKNGVVIDYKPIESEQNN